MGADRPPVQLQVEVAAAGVGVWGLLGFGFGVWGVGCGVWGVGLGFIGLRIFCLLKAPHSEAPNPKPKALSPTP